MTLLEMPDRPPTYDDVLLRAFRDDDVDMLCDLATDPYLAEIGSLAAHASPRGARAFIVHQHERLSSGAGYSFCVADHQTDRGLGTAGLWHADLAAGRATVGYSAAPRSRGHRVGAKPLRALTEFAWTIPELFRIELYVEPRNVASVHVRWLFAKPSTPANLDRSGPPQPRRLDLPWWPSGPRPHPPVRPPRPARPDQDSQPRPARPLRAPAEDRGELAGPTTRPWPLPVAITARHHQHRHQPRHLTLGDRPWSQQVWQAALAEPS